MPSGSASQSWLLDEFVSRLVAVFETMAGERPVIEPLDGSEAPPDGAIWRQPFAGVPGAVWLSAAETDVTAIGAYILAAAGMEDADAETLQSTYRETLSQALAGLAQALSARWKREVTPQDGGEISAPGTFREDAAAAVAWSRVNVQLPARVAGLSIGFERALLDAVVSGGGAEAAGEPSAPAAIAAPASPADAAAPITSRTFDLLLDVELPVSVSFGRAQLQLRDVLKLTTGSIVELNRSIAEPVEVIVNNCVIARGEVVVVEGNFGVRIQQVISRQERLRTLQ